MKRLVLHIGTEKTGTTSIQHFLHANREALASDGWLLPLSLGEPDQRHLAVICNDETFADAYMRRNALVTAEARATACARWTTAFEREIQASAAPNVVISSEHLSSRLFTDSEMERLRNFLTPWFDRIDVIVVLRDPVDAALSLLSTQVQVGDPNGSLPEPPVAWGEGNDRSWISVCDHRQTIQRWEKWFPGRIQVRLFDPGGPKGGSVLDDVLGVMGIAVKPEGNLPPRANESLSSTGIALLAALNRRLPAFDGDTPSPRRGDLPKWVVRHLGGKGKPQPTLEQRAAYDAAFAESNEWVRAQYFPDRPHLFPKSDSGKPAIAPPEALDIEGIADLVASLWDSSSAARPPDTSLAGRIVRKLRRIAGR